MVINKHFSVLIWSNNIFGQSCQGSRQILEKIKLILHQLKSVTIKSCSPKLKHLQKNNLQKDSADFEVGK